MVLKYDPNLESYIYIENPLEVLASAIHRSAHSASGGYSCRIKQAYSRTHVVCIAEKSTSEVSGIADNIPHIYSIRTIKQGSNHIELQSSPNHRSLHWQVTRRRRSTSGLTTICISLHRSIHPGVLTLVKSNSFPSLSIRFRSISVAISFRRTVIARTVEIVIPVSGCNGYRHLRRTLRTSCKAVRGYST